MYIMMDTFVNSIQHTTDCTVAVFNGRMEILLDDGCDQVNGLFRSVEDIELIIGYLQAYVDEVKK